MVCREVETGGSCTAGFQWRQPPGAVPTLVLVESTTPSNWPVALKCVAAASIRTCFRVPRCALVAKLNRAHHLPKLVGRIMTHRVYDFGALRLVSLASLSFFSSLSLFGEQFRKHKVPYVFKIVLDVSSGKSSSSGRAINKTSASL